MECSGWRIQASFKFAHRKIGALNGASAACAIDLDRDGDLDVVAVSAWNLWEKPEAQSMVWFENMGKMSFVSHDLTNAPTHLITLEAADMDRDGRIDLVSGGMHFYPPYSHQSRVTLWRNDWPRGSDSGAQHNESQKKTDYASNTREAGRRPPGQAGDYRRFQELDWQACFSTAPSILLCGGAWSCLEAFHAACRLATLIFLI